jgi:hypothetical protein
MFSAILLTYYKNISNSHHIKANTTTNRLSFKKNTSVLNYMHVYDFTEFRFHGYSFIWKQLTLCRICNWLKLVKS